MDDKLFNELLESVSEAKAIRTGKKKPSRIHTYSDLDVKRIRKKLHYSQADFAHTIGVNTRTLQNWEQGRRHPRGPAQALLRLVDKEPEIVKEILSL